MLTHLAGPGPLAAGRPPTAGHQEAHPVYGIESVTKYPTLYGYILVAPKAHREQVTGDFSQDEYLSLQRVIYRIAEAIRLVIPTERVHILSLGSQQGNRHVHWHIAPLPPGVPYEEQQMEALKLSRGMLELSGEEMAPLAGRIRQAMGIQGVP